MKEKLVVIGAGMASGRLLEHLFEIAPDRFEVTLFNAEPRGNYNRLMLSPVLSGEKTYEQIVTHDDDWYAAHAVDCRFGESIVKIDRSNRIVFSNHGGVPYDKLADEALGAALVIAGFSQIAVMAAKESVNRAFEGSLSDGVMFERRLFHALFATQDQKEGMDAFLGKRKANFVHQ